MPRGPNSLWRSPNFRRFCSGEAISEFGSEITALALPLTAVTLVPRPPSSAS